MTYELYNCDFDEQKPIYEICNGIVLENVQIVKTEFTNNLPYSLTDVTSISSFK